MIDCTKAPPPPQSNVTSECSEAECDREHLLKDSSPRGEHIFSTSLDYLKFSASPEDPAQELTTEEMRKLIERNEIVPTTGLKPYNTVNV